MGRSNTIEGVEAVGAYVSSEPHAGALLTIYTVGVREDDMANVFACTDEVLPGVDRAGILEYPYGIASGESDHHVSVWMNLMLSDDAAVVEHPAEPLGVGREQLCFALPRRTRPSSAALSHRYALLA